MSAESDAKRLGERVAVAREAASLTQQQLADEVGLERSAVAKVERGLRRLTAFELSSIADALGRRMEWFLTEPTPAIVSHRSHEGLVTDGSQIDRLLEEAARDVEFVASLQGDLQVQTPAPEERPGSVGEADDLAERTRQRVGLEDGAPVRDLVSVAASMGLLCFSRDLGPDTADAGTVLLRSGAVALVNSQNRVGRRRLALAHEIAHFLVADEYTVDWRVSLGEGADLEALFDRFARAFLLPAAATATFWRDRMESDSDVRVAAVITASEFRVDMATLARRLIELGVATRDEAAIVRSSQTTKADIIEHNLLVAAELEGTTVPAPYAQAVIRAFRRRDISRERTLGLLWGTFSDDDLPDLPQSAEGEIWKFVT